MLNHPNIIRIHDFHEFRNEAPFISMEYMDGSSLEAVLAKQGPLAWREALDVVRLERTLEGAVIDIEQETVDVQPNFDDSRQEPTVLPSKVRSLTGERRMAAALTRRRGVHPMSLRRLMRT